MCTHLAHRYHHRIICHVQSDAIVKIVGQLNVWFTTIQCCCNHSWDLSVVQRNLYCSAYCIKQIPTTLQNLQKTGWVT